MKLLYKHELKSFFKRFYIFIAFFVLITILTTLIVSLFFPAFWIESEHKRINSDSPYYIDTQVTVKAEGTKENPSAKFNPYYIDWKNFEPDKINDALDYFFNTNVDHFIYDENGNDIVNGVNTAISVAYSDAISQVVPTADLTPKWVGDDGDINYDTFFHSWSPNIFSFWHDDLMMMNDQNKEDFNSYNRLYDSKNYPNINLDDVKQDMILMRLILPLYNFDFFDFYFYNEILPIAYDNLAASNSDDLISENIYNFQMIYKIDNYKLSGIFYNAYASITLLSDPISMDSNDIFANQNNPGLIASTPASFIQNGAPYSIYTKHGGKNVIDNEPILDNTAIFSESFARKHNIDVGETVMIDPDIPTNSNDSNSSDGLFLTNSNYGFNTSDMKHSSTIILNKKYTPQDYLTLSVNRNDFLKFFDYLFSMDPSLKSTKQPHFSYRESLVIDHSLNTIQEDSLLQSYNDNVPSLNPAPSGVIYGGPESAFGDVTYSDTVMQSNILYLIAGLLLLILLVVSFIFIAEEQLKKTQSFFKLKALGFSNNRIFFSSSLPLVLLIGISFIISFIFTMPIINWLNPYLCVGLPLYITPFHIYGSQIITTLILFSIFIFFLSVVLYLQIKKPLFYKADGINLFSFKIIEMTKKCFVFLPSPSKIKLIFALKNFKKNMIVILVFIFGVATFIFSLEINYSIINFANQSSSLFKTDIQTGYQGLNYNFNGGDRNNLYKLFFNGEGNNASGHDQLIYSQSQIDDIKIDSANDIADIEPGDDWVLKLDDDSIKYLIDNPLNSADDLSHYYLTGQDINNFMTNDYQEHPFSSVNSDTKETNYDHYCRFNDPDKTPDAQTELCNVYNLTNKSDLETPPNIFFNRLIVNNSDYKDQLSTLTSQMSVVHIQLSDSSVPIMYATLNPVVGIDNDVSSNVINDIGIPSQFQNSYNKYIINGNQNLEVRKPGSINIPIFISTDGMKKLAYSIIQNITPTPDIDLDDYSDDELFTWLSNKDNVTFLINVKFGGDKTDYEYKVQYTFDLEGFFFGPTGVNFPGSPDVLMNKTILQNMMLNQSLDQPIGDDNPSIDNLFYSTSKNNAMTSNLTYMIYGEGDNWHDDTVDDVSFGPGFSTNYFLNKTLIAKQAVVNFSVIFIITQLLLYTIIFVMLAICIIFISDVLAENKNIIITMKILGYRSSSVISYVISSYLISIIISFIIGYLLSLGIFAIFSFLISDTYGILLQVPLNFSVWLIPFAVISTFILIVGAISYWQIKKAPINNLSFDID